MVLRTSARFCGGGGGDRNRTRDILLAKQTLYQLSYAPTTITFAPAFFINKTLQASPSAGALYQLSYTPIGIKAGKLSRALPTRKPYYGYYHERSLTNRNGSDRFDGVSTRFGTFLMQLSIAFSPRVASAIQILFNKFNNKIFIPYDLCAFPCDIR